MDVPVQCGAQGLSVGEVLRLLWWAEGEQGACGADELLRAAPCTVPPMYRITGVTTHNALSTLNAERSYTIKTDRTGFVFVLDSRSGWQGRGAARQEGIVVVHAPREPNHARWARERSSSQSRFGVSHQGAAVVSSYRPAALIV